MATKGFYDAFWPANVPKYDKTKAYMLATIQAQDRLKVRRALDAGAGHGVCSVVLAEFADEVLAVDLSDASLAVAAAMAEKFSVTNIRFEQRDLQRLELPPASFDLVWCWGVAMMAPEPLKVIRNLMAVVAPGGVLYLGLYLKTWLSPAHQAVRHFCRTFMNTPRRKKFVLDFFAWLTRVIVRLRGRENNLRDDNVSIQAQVDDWYYPPHKTFYDPDEIMALLERGGFTASLAQAQVGRMRSATIFVVRAAKAA
jgi:ubiquinone/menaquinone biosynthesis C-methylase UbiE